MGRTSRAEAARHREEVVAVTSRLLRERGAAGMSVQDLMGAAGLTHGGFYKQFSSKDELLGIAATTAFGELLALLDQFSDDLPDRSEARRALLRHYLSPEHRDTPGTGCANTALAADAARASADSPLRTSYTVGLQETVKRMTDLAEAPGRDGTDARRRALVDLATMVGALTLARATGQTPLSEEILQAAQAALSSPASARGDGDDS
ncbi:TetR family transcriptional regulator [Micromonospora sp. A202]|jgi:TetR/AcrR family transcriptional repressor of nem operon|uniref:TetR/AcrR family transcriptional regulator n=1 Tax=Micromonospora sp. A202 TaxID=2572899 RepID=UPI0011505029|nr:TetR/AcrR family transcriptional regulator [Micromonospora sp. A202]TQJ23898.1 TetR family transcriptional regulator [Micromonospora sp. A202]